VLNDEHVQAGSGREIRPLLAAHAISKSFPGVQALRGVSLSCRPGKVHGLVGGNGAGKSTLVSIITGVQPPDGGRLVLDGEPFAPRSPHDALGAGIAAVYQELTVLPNLSVIDNVFLGQELCIPGRLVDRKAERERARSVLAELGLGALDLDTEASELSVAERQLVEIARALVREARLLILDEPSAVLAGPELESLFDSLRRLVAQGVAILFISHRLSDVMDLCDEITVLRDGQVVSSGPVVDYTPSRIIRDMSGREVAELTSVERDVGQDVVLDVEGLLLPGTEPDGISLQVRTGEILGLAGLMGAGRSRLVRAIAGAERVHGGAVAVRARKLRRNSIRSARRHGVALIPEDRATQGLILKMSVSSNITLSVLDLVARFGVLIGRLERAVTRRSISRFSIKVADPGRTVQNLSGGNQQKVVLARLLASDPAVLLLDEPTRGIDVGTKAELYEIIRDLSRSGIATVIVSSDLPELLALSDRLLVMSGGRVVAETPARDATEERVLALALGQGDDQEAA
jgi:ABC-type sugar transport system ATPase subunit